MKHTFLAVTAAAVVTSLVISLSSCVVVSRSDSEEATAQGVVSRSFGVGHFTEIDASGEGDLILEMAGHDSVWVEARPENLKTCDVWTENGTLYVRHSKHVNTFLTQGAASKCVVHVLTDSIRAIGLSGAMDLNVPFVLSTDTLRLQAQGASDAKLTDLRCQEFRVRMQGASDVKAEMSNVPLVLLDLTGACDARFTFNKCGILRCQANGASTARLSGTLKSIEAQVTGGSDIKNHTTEW